MSSDVGSVEGARVHSAVGGSVVGSDFGSIDVGRARGLGDGVGGGLGRRQRGALA
jgi:hypothetical protein